MSLTLIIGPMFAGKTSQLFSEIERKMIAMQTCLLVKYSGDTRYDHMVPSEKGVSLIARSGNFMSSRGNCTVVKSSNLGDINVEDKDVIGVSEIQFYPDAYDVIVSWIKMGKTVIAEGLNGDFLQRTFPVVGSLISIADKIISLKAVCMDCHMDANFTHRTIANKDLIVVGSDDIYVVVCGKCLHQRQS